jgi:hypothetical protein
MFQKMTFHATDSLSNHYSQASIMGALLAVVLVFATSVSPAFAAAPAQGIVVEGESVPGIALGATRAQVEAAYGEPRFCQSVEAAGDFASCSFEVDSGGQVDVRYWGPDGGNASNSPDDVVHNIRWHEQVSGWTTTAGVNTTLAADNPQAVIDAYPNAEVTYTQWGSIYRVLDYEQGIEVIWAPDFYSGTTHVSMAIFFPRTPPPPREKLTRVSVIDLMTIKRQVIASVRVQNDLGWNVVGASVIATWTFPDDHTEMVTGTSDGFGTVRFTIDKARRGTYTFAIEDVFLDGHVFDRDNSVLSASITKSK